MLTLLSRYHKPLQASLSRGCAVRIILSGAVEKQSTETMDAFAGTIGCGDKRWWHATRCAKTAGLLSNFTPIIFSLTPLIPIFGMK
jgi:hypothetical protein